MSASNTTTVPRRHRRLRDIFHHRLIAARKVANISAREAATRVGWKSDQSWYNYESAGKLPGPAVTEAMAEALGVDPGYLYGWQDVPRTDPVREGGA